MTRTISLIIGIAVTALAVAVPTALGEGRLAGSQDPSATAPDWFERAAIAAQRNSEVVAPDWFERAAAVAIKKHGSELQSSPIVSENVGESAYLRAERLRSEGLNRKYGLGEFKASTVSTYRDAADRVVEPQSVKAERLRSEGLNRIYGLGEFATVNGYVDANERAVPPTSSTPVSPTVSGNDIEWPQIGIGFGIGIVLLLGLGLAMRVTHTRPFAH